MTEWHQRVAAMADAFDQAFAAPPPPPPDRLERLIGIRAGETAYVLRLDELAGLAQAPPIVSLPLGRPGLLGLVGLRGRMLAVFDLAVLLGHASAPAPRWLALLAGSEPVAVAFSDIESHLLVPPSALLSVEGATGPIAQLLTVDGVTRPVIDLPALLRSLSHAPSTQETPT